MKIPKDDNIFLAIDANAIIHRAFHAYPDTLVNSKMSLQVDAVYGFTYNVAMQHLEKSFEPKYIMRVPLIRSETYISGMRCLQTTKVLELLQISH